jgi:hypothetical protein
LLRFDATVREDSTKNGEKYVMKLLRVLCLSLLLTAASSTLLAGPIDVDAGWYGFCFGGAGSGATTGCQNQGVGETGNTITFQSTLPMIFQITDAFQYGDSFDVYVDSVLTLQTPSVPIADGIVTDPDLAWADPGYSKGSILLAPGAYTVEVFVRDSPFQGGGAYLRVDAVPEPGTWALLASGVGLIYLFRRRRA